MKDIDLFQVITQVLPLVGTEDPQREANQGPQVHHRVSTPVMFAEFVNLGVTVVTTRNAVVGAGGLDLSIFESAVFKALLLIPGLQETAAAAATKIVGPVGLHVDKIFFAHHRLDHIAKVFGDGVAVAFANDLAGVLNREFDFQVLVPVGIDLEFAFANPFGVVLIDIFDFKVVIEVEFFQSGPD